MEATNDPLLTIYQQRSNPEIVTSYLAQLDAESKARRSQPEIYKRGYEKKKAIAERKERAGKANATNNKNAGNMKTARDNNMTEEEKARAEKRRKQRQERKKQQAGQAGK